jgi:thiamine pyrophosphate-dependent acetolactate synthase large subunit-like protein
MSSPRWLASLTIPIIASAALVSSAAVASATPTDDAYLNQLRGAGLTWPAGDDDAMIGVAYLICQDLDLNWTPQHIANSIHANLDPDNIHVNDVGSMVNIAHQTYCPDAGYNAGAAGGGGGGGGG